MRLPSRSDKPPILPTLLPLGLLAACVPVPETSQVPDDKHDTSDDSSYTCTVTETPVDDEDGSMGFTGTELAAVIASASPDRVVWDDITQDAPEEALAWGGGVVAGATSIVTRHNGGGLDDWLCRTGPDLCIELEGTLSFADGSLADFEGAQVCATGLDPASLHLLEDLPLTLSADRQSLAETGVANLNPLGGEITRYHLFVGPDWSNAGLGIEADFSDGVDGGAMLLWSGSWTLAPSDP